MPKSTKVSLVSGSTGGGLVHGPREQAGANVGRQAWFLGPCLGLEVMGGWPDVWAVLESGSIGDGSELG